MKNAAPAPAPLGALKPAPARPRRRKRPLNATPGSKSKNRPDSSFDLTRILVPIDFSDCSQSALRLAVRLASALKASILLLYVAEVDPPGAQFKPRHLGGLEKDLRRLTQKECVALQKGEIPRGIRSEIRICAGRSDREILNMADQVNASLIVMGAHSKASREGQLGTTAGRVASLARCPVIIVPMIERPVPFFL